MGNNQKKPFDKVDLFIEVSKNIYQSGQTIQGKLHLNTLAEKLPYKKMTLGFYCQETYLIKASNQTQSYYETSQKLSYLTQLVIHDFTSFHLSKGQYSFPFSIKLPDNMPSSFSLPGTTGTKNKDDKKIQVKYALKAELVENMVPSQNYGDLTKLHYLNIIRPFRSNIQPLNVKKNQYGNSCLCFGRFTTQISIYVDKSFLFSGDKIQINGQVDNMYGGRDLIELNCQLIERNIVTNERKIYLNEKQRGVLHAVKGFYVKKGNVENFSFSYKVPDYLQHSSSMGNYSALVYVLIFQYQFKDGCDPNRLIEIPIHIQTKTPKLQVNIDTIPSSYQWNPAEQHLTTVPMQQQFIYNSVYPLERYRLEFEKLKIDVPSLQYFNKMNAQYPTKNVTSRQNAKSQHNNMSLMASPQNNRTNKKLRLEGFQNMP